MRALHPSDRQVSTHSDRRGGVRARAHTHTQADTPLHLPTTICVHVCVCFNRPYRAYRQGRTRVGLTNQSRTKQAYRGRKASRHVCVCVHVSLCMQAPVQRTASVDPCTDECTLTYVPIAGSHTSAFSVDSWRALPGLQLPRGTSITDMDVFDGWVALYGRYNALPAVWVAHLSTGEHTDTAYSHHTQGLQHRTAQRSTDVGVEQEGQGRPNTYNDTNSVNVQVVKCDRVDLPAWVTDITPGINADPSRRALRVIVSSPAHPPRTCEYDVNTGTLTTLHAEVAAGRPPRRAAWAATRAALGERGWGVHDPDAYGIARLWVPVKGPGLATRAPTELPQHMPVTIAGARDVLEGMGMPSLA